MRAVCTRSGRRGTAMGVCAHEEGLWGGRGEGRGSLFFFSLHATAERIHPRAKKLYYFGGKILFRPSANPSFVSSPFSSLFFQTDHPLFWTARHPTGKGWKPRGERGRNRSSFCTAEILSQTRYYFSYYPYLLLSCVHFAVLLLQSCNHARCKAD